MKKVISIFVLISLLLCGCGSVENPKSEGNFFFYFPPEDPHGVGNLLAVEQDLGENLPSAEELLSLYLGAETPMGGRSLLPEGWRLDSYELQSGGQLVLYCSGADATAIEESLTLACLTHTFSQLEEVHRVKLCPPGDREPLVLSDNDLLLEDMGMFPREEIVLYVPDEEQRYLKRETFMVDSIAEGDKHVYIINQLLERNRMGEAQACIPTGTGLLDIRVENGVCTVDLSSEFVTGMSEKFRVAQLAVYSIVNSLTELEGIRTVDIKVAHSSMEQLRYLDLSKGLRRDESLIAGNSGYDGSIYPYALDSGLLVEVPVWLKEDPKLSREEQLIRALLEYEGIHSVCHSIPRGTALLSVRMAENTCVVDLTAEFTDLAENARSQELAVYSIIATLSTLPDVEAVEILVEGNRPQFASEYLQEVRTVNGEWFENGEE
ncbi:MAG: GerMN domain-containing protein [Oscillospiraceae bacterium]|nr:GerMN domain-containing protein [Oscillospiraceae bacterium]